jgi:hypothetical protein
MSKLLISVASNAFCGNICVVAAIQTATIILTVALLTVIRRTPFLHYHCENQSVQIAGYLTMVDIVGFANLIQAGYFAGSQRCVVV